MKFLTKKSVAQKIILALVIVILFNFTVPIRSQAFDLGESLLKELVHLMASLGDVVMGLLQHMMLGTDKFVGSVMLDYDDRNLTASGSDLNPDNSDSVSGGDMVITEEDFPEGFALDGVLFSDWKVPNIMYCPENIFANRIAALDVNFIHPHEYTPVEYLDDEASETTGSRSDEGAVSSASVLSQTIASWYKSFRNIAIVGLLIVLVYLGIRILISSTVQDKAKYKESIMDWLVALCLVFVIHFIMSGIMMITDQITLLFDNSVTNTIVVDTTGVTGGDVNGGSGVKFRTNLTGYIRFMAQSDELETVASYTIIYLALVIYTVMFTIIYLKRFLYMAFFTMIAPLVALSYPIDRARDGKAQAFNLWFKEYTLNAIIQPVHLLLYAALIGSSIQLAATNAIYAIVAIGFLIPAEKFIKKMFGFDKAETAAGWGAVAGGALAMKGVGKVAGLFQGNASKGKRGNDNTDEDREALPRRGTSSTYPGQDPIQTVFGAPPPMTNSQQTNSPGARTLEGNNDQSAQAAQQPQIIGPNGRPISSEESNTTQNGEVSPIIGPNGRPTSSQTTTTQNTGRQGQQSTTSTVNPPSQTPAQNNTNSTQPETPYGKAIQRVKRTASGVGGAYKRKIANAVRPQNVGKKVWKATKRAGRFGVRTAAKAGIMAAAGATAGIVAGAAALTTGDLSKGASIMAGGIGLSAGIANRVGGSIGNSASDFLGNQVSEAKDIFKESYYEPEELKNKKQEKYDKEWKKKEDHYRYLQSVAGLNDKKAREFLEDDKTQAFLDANITDINTIYNARTMMDKKNYSLEESVAKAKMANSLGNDFADNDGAQKNFIDRIKSKNSNINDAAANNLVDELIDLKKDRRK